jgi:hypothetical protein
VANILGGDSPAASPPEPKTERKENDEPIFGDLVGTGRGERFWFRGDYLAWWTSGTELPALVTTNSTPVTGNTATDPNGALGHAIVLFGNNTMNTDVRSGFRVTAGMWLGTCQRIGVELDYFDLDDKNYQYSATSDATGYPFLARPFYDVRGDANGSGRGPSEWRQLVSYPNQVVGSVTVRGQDYFQGAGAAARIPLCCCCQESCNPCKTRSCRTDLLIGYRYYHLNDSLTIYENPRIIQTGTLLEVTDTFRASNDFHGVEVGVSTQLYRGRWSFDLLAKMALGNNHRVGAIYGRTVTTVGPNQSDVPAGFLALTNSNIGSWGRDDFVIIPQLGLEAGYQITDRLRAFIGYNVLYWACVQRAADLIDRNIDVRNVPGGDDGTPPTHFPEFHWRGSSFWAQGINAGIEVRF